MALPSAHPIAPLHVASASLNVVLQTYPWHQFMFEVSDDQTYKPAGVNATLDIIRAWTSAVPKGKLLLLDLWADSTPLWNISRSFFGADYIWCMCVV